MLLQESQATIAKVICSFLTFTSIFNGYKSARRPGSSARTIWPSSGRCRLAHATRPIDNEPCRPRDWRTERRGFRCSESPARYSAEPLPLRSYPQRVLQLYIAFLIDPPRPEHSAQHTVPEMMAAREKITAPADRDTRHLHTNPPIRENKMALAAIVSHRDESRVSGSLLNVADLPVDEGHLHIGIDVDLLSAELDDLLGLAQGSHHLFGRLADA